MSILISHPFCALHLSQVFHDMMYAQLGHAPARTVVQDTELRHQAGWNREVMSEVGEVQVINSEYEQDKEGPSLFASKKQHGSPSSKSHALTTEVRRLSNHPSIVIWDGCNECTATWSLQRTN